jgi:hypothetical protein
MEYNWVLPGLAPLLLPWLATLGLLTLKPNRRAAAWLIWLPLVCVMAITTLPSVVPSGAEFLFDAAVALAFGLAAVWLLSNFLRQRHRLLTFFCVLITLCTFSGMALVTRQGWNLFNTEVLQISLLLGVGVLATTAALTLDGWICRRGFRPLGIYLWLFISLAAIWLALALPFFLIAVFVSRGSAPPWSEFFIPVLSVAFGNFLLLLPFLILSSASPFFRDRLKALLNVQREPPPMLAPVSETNLKT